MLAVDLFTVFGQVIFPLPDVRRFLDLVRHLFCFVHDVLKFPLQSSVESCAGDGFFRFRPGRLVLVGIRVWGRRWAAHVPILRGRILCLSETLFLPAYTFPPLRTQSSTPGAALPPSA